MIVGTMNDHHGGAVTTIEGPKFRCTLVTTKQEGLFKGLSMTIWDRSEKPPRALAEAFFSDSLNSVERRRAHFDIAKKLDAMAEQGRLFQESADLVFGEATDSGTFAEWGYLCDIEPRWQNIHRVDLTAGGHSSDC